MINNFTNNFKLFERCLELMDESFEGCKQYAHDGIRHGAHWDKVSTPFVIEENGELIAHAGVWPIKFMLNGQEHTTACLHGICVKKEFRSKGHFQRLMQELMQYIADYDSSIMFVTKPYLYKSYPYRMMLPEYDFVIDDSNCLKTKLDTNASPLRIINLENIDDLKLMHQILNNRIPLSNQLSVMNPELFILNAAGKPIFYSERLNCLIVYEITDHRLYLKEIISSTQTNIADIVAAIKNYEKKDYTKVVLQFYPDCFLNKDQYLPVLARPRCCILASREFVFKDPYFRYPELYWC